MNFILNKLDPLVTDLLNMPVFPTTEHRISLWMLLYMLVFTVLVVLFGTMLRKYVLESVFARFSKLDVGMRHSLSSVISWLVMGVGFIVVLDTAGVDVTMVTVVVGALGLGASMSLQTIATNIMSGIVIHLERPISVGDRVEIGEVVGKVVDISLRSTAIVTDDNIAVIVPNSEFVSSRVVNWSYKDKNIRYKVALSVPNDCDPELVRELLKNVALSHDAVLKTPEPEVLLTDFCTDTIKFELLVWTREGEIAPASLQSDLNYKISKSLRNANLKLPVAEENIMESAHELTKS